MDADVKQKLWVIMQDMGRARDRFFIHYSGAGRDTDLRDELLVMEAAAKRALALLGGRWTMDDVRCENSAPAAQDREEVRHG